jgi:predicted RNase H-like nuclease (RuvC/YqgF family)
MAIKKGKGLVQDRDNLKGLINEKNSEIERLKVDLQKQESAVSEYKDEINRLSSDLENIPKLEAVINEKNSEIEQLKVDLQNQESAVCCGVFYKLKKYKLKNKILFQSGDLMLCFSALVVCLCREVFDCKSSVVGLDDVVLK